MTPDEMEARIDSLEADLAVALGDVEERDQTIADLLEELENARRALDKIEDAARAARVGAKRAIEAAS